ncbi:hypothetical protein [Moorena producens]|uniref:hypothetical protein n=1 Tax=Moorena producens TaxID=1155739 RepID=UPI003C791802
MTIYYSLYRLEFIIFATDKKLCASLFPVPCSLFPVPCSLFPVPCSLLQTVYLAKPVQQSN